MLENSERTADFSSPTEKIDLSRLKYEAFLLPVWASLMLLSDIAIAVGSFILAYWIRQGEPVFIVHHGSVWPNDVAYNFRPYFSLLLFVPIVRILALRHYDLYRLRGEFSIFHDLNNLFKATMVGSLIISSVTFLYRGGLEYRDFSYSRLVFVYDWMLAMGFYTALRLIVRSAQTLYRQQSGNLIPALVVGCGQNAQICISEFSEKPRLGYRVVGVLTANGETPISPVEGVPVLGHFRDLPALVRQYGIKEVLITDERISPQDIFNSMMRCGRKHRVEFSVVPNLFNCLPRKTGIEQIGSLPMVKLFEEPLRGPNRWLKRSTDLTLSIIALIVSSPLWIVITLLIKATSRGSVLYRQERVGMDGRVFRAYKFRSMYDNADDSLHRELMEKTINNASDSNQGSDEKPVYGKVKDDPRITPIGDLLRRYSFDELPQLLNVIRGEMSLVGPRPPIPYEVEAYQDWHRARFHVKPGITGLWQVSGRNRLSFDQMVKLDIYYIENWSIWLDLKILLKTIPVVLEGEAQ